MKGSLVARILVVEDDVLVLCTLTRQLTDLGHACISTTSPRMALAAASACRPDLLVLDYAMPELDGAALASEVLARDGICPPVVFVTAHPQDVIQERLAPALRVRFVEKPFSREGLAREVGAALAAGAAADRRSPEAPRSKGS